jgi:hypothetical protein
MVQVAVLVDSSLPKLALAKDKRRQEDATTEQRRADNEHLNAPVIPPNPIDAAIGRIQADCALCAAPLNAILAEIERNEIAH